ncbi:hypothetical protein P4S70_10610 [Enterovibrio sp. Hal110]
MKWDKENDTGYTVKTIGHSRSQVVGDSHAYVFGNAVGINLGNTTGLHVGSKEAITVGFDVSLKLAAVLDISYGFKWEVSFVKKVKTATIAKSISKEETKTTQEYNLLTNVKKEIIKKNEIYIGGNTEPVKDVSRHPVLSGFVGKFGRRDLAKNSKYAERTSHFRYIKCYGG